MKVGLTAPCFNEERFLPYFLRHYSTFCDKIFIFDNCSTDKSKEIIKSLKFRLNK
jgi:glycosyltransferase involved in cell wall biosynthesis